jgi:sec-independent protein translocase protein TatA
MIGTFEAILIFIIILLLFGAGKLPELGEGLGKGIRNFKKALKGEDEIDVTPLSKKETPEKK